MKLKCVTCGKDLVGEEDFVKFQCPQCGEMTIVRCRKCKTLSSPYKCVKCGFEGP
jgi:predicted RNA-binding Zn-ribbon protein involved in translation (DUF1610 family)